jgi:hypothetical protein
MQHYAGLLRKHYLAVVFALLIGVVSVGPNLIFSHSTGYEGIPIFGMPDENYYMARLEAAYTGCFWNCNPFVPEVHPPAFSDASLSEPILALPGILFHLTVGQLDMLFEFFFPFVLTLLFYSLIYRIAKNRLIALFGTCIIMCGFDFFSVEFISFSDPLWMFFAGKRAMYYVTSSFLAYSRPVNPQVSSVLFVLYAHALLSYFETRKRVWLILSALASACAWYLYLYLATFILAVNVSVLVILSLQKQFKECVAYALATIASIVLALPSILNLLASLQGGPTATSQFIIHTHGVAYTYQAICILVAFIALAWIYTLRYPKTHTFYFILTLVLASCLIVEQQVLLGIEPELFHYEWYYNTPIAVFAACFFASQFLLGSLKRFLYVTISFAIVWMLVCAVCDQYMSYHHWYKRTMTLQKYMPTLQEINAGPQGVVYTSDNPFLLELVPMFTHEYVPDAPSASIYKQI